MEEVTVNVNPHDVRFLRDRTGVDSTQDVVTDALNLYKAAVLGAMDKKELALITTEPDGKKSFTALDFAEGRLEYAKGNADIPSITQGDVDSVFQKYVEAERKGDGRVDESPKR